MLAFVRAGLLLIVSVTVLVACDSSEERAEGHYQRGLELAAEGDIDRALVELRNVFKLNGQHRDARWTYAELTESRGDIREAFGQLLRLVEQYPEDAPARVALTRLALDSGNWSEVERHYDVAAQLSPDEPIIRSARLVLDYRTAIQDRNEEAVVQVAEAAAVLKDEVPSLFHVRRLVIDHLMREQELEPALQEVDGALALREEDRELHGLR